MRINGEEGKWLEMKSLGVRAMGRGVLGGFDARRQESHLLILHAPDGFFQIWTYHAKYFFLVGSHGALRDR